MSYNCLPSMTSSVTTRQISSTMTSMAMETSWSGASKERKLEVNDISGLEKMKEQVRGFNRDVQTLRMQLVEMRVETSLPLGSAEIVRERHLSDELEMLRQEVEN